MAFDPFSMLASAVGGGLGFLVGGPMGAAIGSGLGTTAYTGDLGKGIASGLLSYGLGSAAEGLAGAAGGLGGGSGAAVDSLAGWGEMASPAASAIPHGASAVPAGTAGLNVATSTSPSAPGLFDTFSRAAEGITKPGALYDVFGKNFMKTTLPIGIGAYSMFGDSGGQGGYVPASTGQQPSIPFPGNRGTGRRYLGPGTPSPLGYERTYFGYQEGGRVRERAELNAKDYNPSNPQKRREMYEDAEWRRAAAKHAPVISPEEAESWLMERRGDDLSSRNPYTDIYEPPKTRFESGGPVSGPGGGLDDAIPAMINGRQPAKLSSGEYVVPAHAVSALGNGSTEEGVRQLDKMVDHTMQAKFGTKNRKPRPIRAEKMTGVASGIRPFAAGGLVPRSLLNVVEGRGTPMEMLQAYAFISEDGDPRETMRRGLDGTLPPPQPPQEREPEDGDTDLSDARERISRVESGGNYGALGPMVGKDRAYGRYQVMGSNIPSWTKEALGQSLTAEEFLADKKAQDAVFNHRFGGYMKKYGPAGAARAWFAGEGGMNNRGARDALGTSVDDYERKFRG